jgi:uncharacterized protein (TIGR03437 family)
MVKRSALLKVSIIILAARGILAAQAGASGAPASLTLVSGTLGTNGGYDGQAITAANRVITVLPGAPFGGSVTFQLKSTDAMHILLGVTPNWGDRTTSYVNGGNFSGAVPAFGSSNTLATYLNFTAPSSPGTYWIIAAAGNEGSVANLLSCTSSIAGNAVWNDGNDVADWSLSTIQTANTSGTVQVPYLYSSGPGWASIAATAIQVNVADIPGYTVSTVAGGGTVPLGASSLSLELGQPVAVLVDAAGNRYVAVANQNRVLRVNPSGKIDLVIGDGLPGFAGDGGPASAARLYLPSALAMDQTGNLYIADSSNLRVRMVTMSSGIITTVAGSGTYGFGGDGGPATKASFNAPSGLAFDASGNLFILDQGNQRIRRVDSSTGIITTVAGNGTAGFAGDGGAATSGSINNALGIAVGAPGSLFIADSNNNRVRKVSLSTGLITTVAGTGAASFSGDGGAATAAALNNLTAVAVDSSGNLYVSDYWNGRVRRVDASTGIISTMVGGGSAMGDGGPATKAHLARPGGIAFDGSGNLFIADSANNRVRKVATGTQIITTVDGGGSPSEGSAATSAILEFPAGVAVDLQGNIYVAATNNHRIRRIDRTTGAITTFAGTGVAGFGGDNGPATSASLNFPLQLAFDAAGNLFIADSAPGHIRKIAAGTGVITTVVGGGSGGDGSAATAASLSTPFGVALDALGNIFIADSYNNRVRKVAATTGIITTVAGTGTGGFAGDGGPAKSANLLTPQGVTLDGAGNLFIVDTNNQRIRRVDAATVNITTIAGNGSPSFSGDGGPASASGLSYPQGGISVDAAGNILLADTFNNRIRRVYAGTGLIMTVAGGGSDPLAADGDDALHASLPLPNAVTLAPNGSIYFSERASNRIRLLTQTVTQRVLLTINKSGSGGGTVTAIGSGFSCGAICTILIDSGTALSLTAAADPNSTFTGWSGACSGASVCAVTMGAPATVIATFTQKSPTAAVMFSPSPSSVLQSEFVTFAWNPGSLVTTYSLKVGNSPGGTEFYAGNSFVPSAAVSGLPSDGTTVYVRLSSLIAGVWQDNDYSYTTWRADSQSIYEDAFRNRWSNCSSGQTNSNNSSPVHSGNSSISVTLAGHANLCVSHPSAEGFFDFSWFDGLSLWLHGGTSGGQLLQVQASVNGALGPIVPLPSLAAGIWQQASIPVASLGLNTNTKAAKVQILIQGLNASAQSTFYVDDIALTISQPPSAIHVSVNAAQVIRTADPRHFGINTAFWDYPPLATLTAALGEMNVQALRFPGGSSSDDFHWATANPVAGNSFDDFAQVAKSIGAQAFITVNYGSGTATEAASWVAYSKAHNYGIRYWEVGNESYGSWETDNNIRPNDPYTYAVRFKDYYTQIKAADPTARVGAVVEVGEDNYANYTDHPATNPRTGVTHNGWTPVVLSTLNALGVTPDFLIYHKYNLNGGWANDFELLQSANSWGAPAADLRQQLNDYLGTEANKVELVNTEHNRGAWITRQTTSLVNGLFLADSVAYAIQTEFNAVLWWNVLNDPTPDYDPSLYGWRMYSNFGVSPQNLKGQYYPTFYAIKILQHFARAGDQVLSANTGYPLLSAHATKRSDGSLSLLVVNQSPVSTLEGTVSVNGFTPAPNAVVYSYGIPQDEAARTGAGSPDIAQTTFSGASNNFNYSFPPYSITVISMSPAPAAAVQVTSVNVAGGGADVAPNSWIEIKGAGLAPADLGGGVLTWSSAPEFASGKMPTQLGGVSVKVNGKPAYIYYVSATQVNVLTPLDTTTGTVMLQVTNGANTSAPFPVNLKSAAPAFLLFGSTKYIAATHADGSLLGPASMSVPGYTFTPAKPGETIVLYGAGFGLPAGTLAEGASSQTGALATPPAIQIGGKGAAVTFAGVVSPGLYQLNVVVPSGVVAGDNAVTATYPGASPVPTALIAVLLP